MVSNNCFKSQLLEKKLHRITFSFFKRKKNEIDFPRKKQHINVLVYTYVELFRLAVI